MAKGSALTVAVLMVFFDKNRLVRINQTLDFIQAMHRNSPIISQSYGIKPKFAILTFKADMNVRRLIPFIRIKVKPVGTYPEFNCWP